MDALLLLEKGAANDAALLCVSGLGTYPDYLGGYVLLSKAYAALDRPLDARIILEEAQRRFPFYKHDENLSTSNWDVDVTIETNQGSAPVPEFSTASLVDSSQDPEPPREAPLTTDNPREAPLTMVTPRVAPLSMAPTRVASTPMISPLRIIDTAQITDDTRIIRSSSVRLIPGLEFTTLRFEGTKTRGRREIQTLSEPPAFRRFHPARRVLQPISQQTQMMGTSQLTKPKSKPLSLEELANRLERARMPRSGEAATPMSVPQLPSHPTMPTSANLGIPRQLTLVTETIARIYMQQGAYEKAIDAFAALAISKPEKSEEFQRIIAELTAKLNS